MSRKYLRPSKPKSTLRTDSVKCESCSRTRCKTQCGDCCQFLQLDKQRPCRPSAESAMGQMGLQLPPGQIITPCLPPARAEECCIWHSMLSVLSFKRLCTHTATLAVEVVRASPKDFTVSSRLSSGLCKPAQITGRRSATYRMRFCSLQPPNDNQHSGKAAHLT